jgi:hypothetical protein
MIKKGILGFHFKMRVFGPPKSEWHIDIPVIGLLSRITE